MKEEFNFLIENDIWNLIPLPNSKKVLGGKWVYKRKRVVNINGELRIRYKARWVAKGYLQRHEIDFDQTWALVIKSMTYKTLFAFAAANQWHIRQGDVKIAFLNREITEKVYVEQPIGYKINKTDQPILFCRLNKILYGLKQSARV
jgi:hypothetical protein